MVPADRDARLESVHPSKRARMSPGRDKLSAGIAWHTVTPTSFCCWPFISSLPWAFHTIYSYIASHLAELTLWLPEDGELADENPKGEELKSPNSTVRESTRLRNKATMSAKAKQDSSKAQQDSGQLSPHAAPPLFISKYNIACHYTLHLQLAVAAI